MVRKGRPALRTVATCLAVAILACAAIDRRDASADEITGNMLVNVGWDVRNLNLVGVSKHFPIDKKTSTFVTAGFDNMFVGGGVVRYAEGYRSNGFLFSGAIGISSGLTAHGVAGYQFRVDGNHWAVGGAGVSMTAGSKVGGTLALAYEYKF